ncbi:hypothetical protein MANES_12G018101v8, partial [Manihot esculenta]
QNSQASAQADQNVSSSGQQNSAASSGQSTGQDSSASSTSSSTQQAQGTASGQTSASSSLEAQGAASGQTSASSSQQALGTANGQIDTTHQSQGSFSASGSASATFKGQFTKVFAFGDSFTDTGNAASLEGVKPFGHLPFAKPGNLPGHRMSNGKLLIDFLCEDLGLPSIKAYKDASGNFSSGANFAVAGSTCLASKFFTTHKMLHSLMFKQKPENALIQIDWFNNFLLNAECKGLDEAQCKAHLSNCLFWVGALGLSDYARIIGSAIHGKSLTEASVDHVCKILKDLLDKGAKYVVVQGLPPAGCCPLQMLLNPPRERDSMGCSSGLNALIQAHNEVLEQRLVEFREQYQGTVIIYADTWKAYKTIMLNHKKFHFEEPFKACCGAGGGPLNFDLHSLCGSSGTSVCKNPQNFISWDGIHFTEAMHKRLFDMFVHQGFCSPSFDVLIQAKMKGGLAQGAAAFAAKGKENWCMSCAGTCCFGNMCTIVVFNKFPVVKNMKLPPSFSLFVFLPVENREEKNGMYLLFGQQIYC